MRNRSVKAKTYLKWGTDVQKVPCKTHVRKPVWGDPRRAKSPEKLFATSGHSRGTLRIEFCPCEGEGINRKEKKAKLNVFEPRGTPAKMLSGKKKKNPKETVSGKGRKNGQGPGINDPAIGKWGRPFERTGKVSDEKFGWIKWSKQREKRVGWGRGIMKNPENSGGGITVGGPWASRVKLNRFRKSLNQKYKPQEGVKVRREEKKKWKPNACRN